MSDILIVHDESINEDDDSKVFLDPGLGTQLKLKMLIIGDRVFQGKEINQNIINIFNNRFDNEYITLFLSTKYGKKYQVSRVYKYQIKRTFHILSVEGLILKNPLWSFN